MTALTITSKGQVTLRKELLQHLGVGAGGRIEVEKLPDGRLQVSAAVATGTVDDVFGVLERNDGVRLSIEEINEAAAEGWAGRR